MTTATKNALLDYLNFDRWATDLARSRGGISRSEETAKVSAAFARLVKAAGSPEAAVEAIKNR